MSGGQLQKASRSGLSIINEHRKLLPGPHLLHDLVSAKAPDCAAIEHLDANGARQKVSYKSLEKWSHSLALQLRSYTLSRDGESAVIPVIIPQCPELYVTYLAVLRSGAGFCPISPDTPEERLKFIVADVNARVVLTVPAYHSQIQRSLSNIACLQISLDALESRVSSTTNGQHTDSFAQLADPNVVAYVMYTSGSTGLPKGVRISHESVTQSLLAHDQHIPSFKRFLQFASPTFDVSVFEIFFPLLRGATLVSCEREHMLADLPGVIRRLDIDAAELTPTVAGTLLQTRAAAPCLKILLTIGEMLSRHVVNEFGGSDDRESMLYAMYGPTEAAIHCTLAPRLAASSSVRNIGVPLATVTAFILAETDTTDGIQIAPVGQTGELAVGGQLASGYLNRPDQTAAAFIDLPDYGQIYRTGDRAVLMDDGNLHIIGRISAGQVKLRGQRVELGEIEEVACKAPGVQLAAACVIDDALILFCAGTQDIDLHQIQSTCKSWLPRFMRPNDVVLLRHGIPRLSSGKIDRSYLVSHYSELSPKNIEAPTQFESDEERRIASIIQSELQASIHANSILRSSGLDSLRAIKIASDLRPSHPQVTVPLILEAETVKDLARSLSEERPPSRSMESHEFFENSQEWLSLKLELSQSIAADLDHIEHNILPCSSMQIAMLTETMSDPELNFNIFTLKMTSDVAFADVEAAFQQVASHNPLLRSGFIPTESSRMPFAQIVWPRLPHQCELGIKYPFHISTPEHGSSICVRIHHALYDGWSWELIMLDVNRVLHGRKIVRRPQFNEFRNLAERIHAECSQTDTSYWQKYLSDFRLIKFPSLSPRKPSSQNRNSIQRTLSTRLNAIEERTSALKTSKQTIVQAALVLLLSSYIDSNDVVFGSVVSDRILPFRNIDQLIGPCLSTYPLRVNLASVATIRDLLLYIQRQHAGFLRHGSLSLSEIKQAGVIPAGDTLFDSLFVWQESLNSTDQSSHTSLLTVNTTDVLNYIFVMEAIPEDHMLHLKLTFQESKIPLEHAQLLLQQMDELVASLTTNLDARFSEQWLSLSHKSLSISNADFKPFDMSFSLFTTIEKLATSDPDRVAVQFITDADDPLSLASIKVLTYKELYHKSLDVARVLYHTYHIKPDDLICVHMNKGVDLYVAILAIIMTGAAYMCIDPRTPEERIAQILQEARCKLTIIHDTRQHRHKDSHPQVSFDRLSRQLFSVDLTRDPLPRDALADCLAYAVFTSGSTGIPKGVLITQKNLLSNIEYLSRIYPSGGPTDKLLQSCSQAFDVSVFEIFWTWHMGITLCSATNDVLFNDIESFIDILSITHLSMTPSVAALVNPKKVPKVQFLVTAGEPMNSKVFEAWADNGLYQGYGPSETTNICNVRARAMSNDLINNVGPAFANTSIFVCLKQDKRNALRIGSGDTSHCLDFVLLPKGASGEIWVGGDQVGRGYIDSKLTQQSWIDHPEYGRLYRSGDIGRLLADDSLIILGREDDQIKLRGQRIELGEINSTLIRDQQIQDAITLLVDKDTDARLVSFYIPRERPDDGNFTPLPSNTIFENLSARLPPYMIPDTILPVEHIPLTRQGKVDHRLLTHMYRSLSPDIKMKLSQGYQTDEIKEPLTDQEMAVARMLSHTTDTPLGMISRNTSFYGLGLNSINSIRFAHELRKAGFSNADVSTILRNPTLQQLLEQLQRTSSANSSSPGINSREFFNPSWRFNIQSRYADAGLSVESILPCTPLQVAMLSSTTLEEGDAYLNTLIFDVNIDLELLRKAWATLVKRHELLRTAFVESPDTNIPYAQLILRDFQLPWYHSDESSASLRVKSLDMPPYRFTVHKREQNEDKSQLRLQLHLHHVMYDAEAMSVLLQEVEQTLHGLEMFKSVPFADYIQYSVNMDIETVDTFWRTRFADMRPTRLTEAIPVSDLRHSSHGDFVEYCSSVSTADMQKSQGLDMLAPLTIFQTALARLLNCYTGSKDLCFGNVFSGRNLPIDHVTRIIGPCFNTLPVRLQLKDLQSTREVLDNLQQQNLEILPFQPSSLRRIQRQVSPDGKILFDVLMLVQQESRPLDSSVWTLVEETGNMSFPFIFEILPDSGSHKFVFRLHFQHVEKKLAATILSNFDSILCNTIRFPQAVATDVSFLHDLLPQLNKPTQQIPLQLKSHSTTGMKRERWTPLQVNVGDILKGLTTFEGMELQLSTTIFNLGLDSIDAVRIAAKLRDQSYEIRGADILEALSVEEIAAFCETHQTQKKDADASAFDVNAFDRLFRHKIASYIDVNTACVETVLPCTSTQSGILVQYLKSDGKLYYNTTRLSLEEDTDTDKLRQAWAKLTHSHQMLRAGFVQLDDFKHPFVTVIYKSDQYQLPWLEKGTKYDAAMEPRHAADKLARHCWNVSIDTNSEGKTMVIQMLHALYDMKSLSVLLSDLHTLYTGNVLREPPSIKSALTHLLDTSYQKSNAQHFWSNMAQDMQPTKFPDLRIYQDDSTQLYSRSAHSSLSSAHIYELCSRLGISFQTACHATWAKLLAAYTGQSKVTFGVILSGRDFDDTCLKDVAFPCINTLPLALDTSNGVTDLLTQTAERNTGLLRFQHTPLTWIKRDNNIVDNLFDTLVVIQKLEEKPSTQNTWRIVDDDASAEYIVSLEVFPHNGGHVGLRMTLRPDVIPRAHADLLFEQFDAMLEQVLDGDSSFKASMLSVLPPKEACLVADVMHLHEFVERSAITLPEKIALEFVTNISNGNPELQTWTYEELNSRGNQIANLLISRGAEVGDLVGVCFDKCPEASFAILGVLKAGCGYVAIDPNAPPARQDFILKDAHCNLLLTTNEKTADFEGYALATIPVDSPKVLNGVSTASCDPKGQLTAQHTCYCLYTSGTTGTPKGCLISHESAVQAMLSFSRIFTGRWTSESRWLQFASFHFDVSVLEQYWTWSEGIRMTSVPRDLLFEDLPGTINKLDITHLALTPSLARLLTPEAVPKLHDGVFIVGGEQVRQDTLDVWGDYGCLYNFYGPSEVTIGCTVHARVPKNAKPTNIGRQWDNVGSVILAPASDEPVIRGAVGELCLSGPLVGKGYLNRPDLTGSKFIHLEKYELRIYRSGDLVRLLHDDSFEFLGRIDGQIKLRGQRLEVGEINHVILSKGNQVTNASTLVLKQPNQGNEQLVSFFSTSTGLKTKQPRLVRDTETQALAAELRQSCSERLPSYMVPTYLIGLNFMPLSANNKIETKILEKLFLEATSDQSQNSSNLVERNTASLPPRFDELAALVASYFGADPTIVRPDSSLLELGLDSISVVGLARTMAKKGFPALNVSAIMSKTCVLDLSQLVEISDGQPSSNDTANEAAKQVSAFAKMHHMAVCSALDSDATEVEQVLPCTPLQQGMISKAVNSNADNIPYFSRFSYKLDKDVDVDVLQQAWKQIAEQLGILRTYFVETEDGYSQAIRRDAKVQSLHILGHATASDVDLAFRQWICSAKAFGQLLPWQVCFNDDGDSSPTMSLFMFHGLYDGISLPLLLDAVKKSYLNGGSKVGRLIQFHDMLTHGPLSYSPDAGDFWRRSLSSIQLLGLTLDDGQNSEASLTKTTIGLSNIHDLSNKLSVTVPAVFHAAWLYTLFTHYQVNPTIGIVLSGRALATEGSEDAIGPMFNTIPCSINSLPADPNMHDLIKACHAFNVQVLPYQHSPVRSIAKWLGRNASKTLFDSLFVFIKTSKPETDRGTDIWQATNASSQPDYPLNIEIEQYGSDDVFGLTLLVTEDEKVNSRIADELRHTYEKLLIEIVEGKNMVLRTDFVKGSQSRAKAAEPSLTQKQVSIEANNTEWSDASQLIQREIAFLASQDQSKIGLDTPTIFELGLDSIDALKLVARLKKNGLMVPTSKIMRYPSVKGIATHSQWSRVTTKQVDPEHDISDHQNEWRAALSKQGCDLTDIEAILPVTSMQAGLLLGHQQYYHVLRYKLRNGANVDRLMTSANNVLDQIASMRVRFVPMEDVESSESFFQLVTARTRNVVDYLQEGNSISIEDVTSSIQREANQAGLTGQKLRLVVAQSINDLFLMICLPHALFDGWSIRLFVNAIERSYDGEAISSQPVSFFMSHLEQIRRHSFASSTIHFWESTLEKAQSTILTLPKTSGPTAARVVHKPSKVSTDVVNNTCRALGITMQSVGFACWKLLLAFYTKSLDTVHGAVLSGRTTEGSDELVFPTFNTVLFRSIVDITWSRADWLKRLHGEAVEMHEHQHFPLNNALRIAGSSGSGLFNTLFTYQKTPMRFNENAPLLAEYHSEEDAFDPPYAFNVEMTEKEGQMWWTLGVQDNTASDDQMMNMIQQLDHVLHGLVSSADEPLGFETDDGLSICGLDPITLVEHQRTTSNYVDQTQSQAADTWSDLELRIRDILSEVSKVDRSQISKSTGLFHLGLDSISTIKVAAQFRKEGLRLSVSEFVHAQTVEQIAVVLTQNEQGQADHHNRSKGTLCSLSMHELRQMDIKENDIDMVTPATAGQVYMLDMWRASNGHLNSAEFWFEVKDISQDTLERAFLKLASRVPALRTTFVEYNGDIFAVTFTNEAARRYNLPWQLNVVKGTRSLLVELSIHHVLYDAVSLDGMITEWAELCCEQRVPAVINTDMKPFLELTQSSDGEAEKRRRSFWSRYLKSTTSGEVTVQLPGSFSSSRHEVFVPDLLPTADLLAKIKKYGIGIQSLVFAAYAQVHASLRARLRSIPAKTQDDYVILGVYLGNRSLDIDNLPSLLAPTINIVPIKIMTDKSLALTDIAKQIQDDLHAVSRTEHCGASLRQVHEWTGVKVDGYMNFLRLPDSENSELGSQYPAKSNDSATIKHARGDSLAKAQDLFKHTHKVMPSPFLFNAQARCNSDKKSQGDLPQSTDNRDRTSWCIPSIDFEAKVMGDGQLAVGMFAPADMLDLQQINAAVGDIKALINSVVKNT